MAVADVSLAVRLEKAGVVMVQPEVLYCFDHNSKFHFLLIRFIDAIKSKLEAFASIQLLVNVPPLCVSRDAL